jgi:hypothetical protein
MPPSESQGERIMADEAEGNDKRLNKLVAITVVILSVAMAISKIKDDNIN